MALGMVRPLAQKAALVTCLWLDGAPQAFAQEVLKTELSSQSFCCFAREISPFSARNRRSRPASKASR
jgi:hypothetical protein